MSCLVTGWMRVGPMLMNSDVRLSIACSKSRTTGSGNGYWAARVPIPAWKTSSRQSVQGNSDHRQRDWTLGPSAGAALVLSVLTFLGLAAAFLNDLPLIMQIPIALLVMGIGAHGTWRLLHPAVVRLKVDDQHVRVCYRGGSHSTGALAGTPFVSPVYVGLRWRPQGKRLPRSLGVFTGQMSEPDFRRLCAALRQQGES